MYRHLLNIIPYHSSKGGMDMFFGKNQTGYYNQPLAYHMVNQHGLNPLDGYSHEQMPDGICSFQTPMSYACEPYICGPCESIEQEKPQPQVYVVQKGDTVYKIAQRFGLDWRELAGYNRLGNPDLIYPGERLFIPPRY